MKPSEFSEVLLPPLDKMSTTSSSTGTMNPGLGVGQPPYIFTNIIGSTKKRNMSGCAKFFLTLIITCIIISLTACTVYTILRYEAKLNSHHARIVNLENQLEEFIEAFEIKALISTIHQHDHAEDRDRVGGGIDDDEIKIDSLEDIDFANDLMDPSPSSSHKIIQQQIQQRKVFPYPHHQHYLQNRNNDMSDEDFTKNQSMDESSEEADEDDDKNDAYWDSDELLSPRITIKIEDEGIVSNKNNNNKNGEEEKIEENIVFGQMKLETPHDKTKLSRHKRQASSRRSEDGVPIVDGSYSSGGRTTFLPVPTPTESEGLRLYESLIATGGRGEPKAPEYEESEGTNVQPYHRTSAAWTERSSGNSRLELKSGDYGSSSGPTLASDYFYVRGQTRPTSAAYGSGSNAVHRQSWRSSSTEAGDTVNRSSRVSSADGSGRRRSNNRARINYPPLRTLGQGDGEVVARVHQDGRDQPMGQAASGANFDDSVTSFAESRYYKNGVLQTSNQRRGSRQRQQQQPRQYGTSSTRQRKTNDYDYDEDDDDNDIVDDNVSPLKDEFSFVKAEAWAEGPKTYAAHYVGDASNYSISHRHYEGNGRLRNADGIFTDWKASDWMNGNDASKEGFVLNSNGGVTIKKEGIYYIYAQIHYLDEHDINGFHVVINTAPFLQCTTMTETHHTNSRKTKSNTCFTGGVTQLKENDQLLIKDIETARFSIFKSEKSFFGLMRIGPMGSTR